MLKKLIEGGYGKAQDFCCSEKILYGANEAYGLGLDEKALKVSAGFCGGMGIGGTCGVLTSAHMILGPVFVARNAHGTPRTKELCRELSGRFKDAFGSLDCSVLKPQHGQQKCFALLLKAAEILDDMIQREQKAGTTIGLCTPLTED